MKTFENPEMNVQSFVSEAITDNTEEVSNNWDD